MKNDNRKSSRRDLLLAAAVAAGSTVLAPRLLAQTDGSRLRAVATQYIAALADPRAGSGSNAKEWGLWRLDPGPRGVTLADYARLQAHDGVAPAGWKFDPQDWWLEEHGLIMEQPEFPLPSGRYLVTGGRQTRAILTVQPDAGDGSRNWALDNNATIYDVTHLRCRSGRYTTKNTGQACTPAQARQADFPVRPGAEMPAVNGCEKVDYAVLIVEAIGDL